MHHPVNIPDFIHFNPFPNCLKSCIAKKSCQSGTMLQVCNGGYQEEEMRSDGVSEDVGRL